MLSRFINKIQNRLGNRQYVLDGRIHRIPTPDKKNKKNGFYVGVYNEFKKIFHYGNMRTGERITIFPDNDPIIYDNNTLQKLQEEEERYKKELKIKKERNCCAFPDSSPGTNDFGNIKRTQNSV